MGLLKKSAVAILGVLIISSTLPFPGHSITYKEEEELSKQFMALVASRFTFIKDPIIEDYVNDIGQRTVP